MEVCWLLEISVDGRAAWYVSENKFTHDANLAMKCDSKETAKNYMLENHISNCITLEHVFC